MSRNVSITFLILIGAVAIALAILGYFIWKNHDLISRVDDQQDLIQLQQASIKHQQQESERQQAEIEALGKSTHDTLCIVRTNLAGRLARAEEYNADVRSGKRPLLPGFALAELEKDVADQQATLKGLGGLRCGEGS